MSCVEALPTLRRTVRVDSEQDSWVPLDEWLDSIGTTSFDFVLQVLAIEGDVEVIPGLQWAAVRARQPDSPAAISGSRVDAVGLDHYRPAVTATDKFLVRPGVLARLKTSGTAGWVQVELVSARRRCGRVLGQREREVYPESDVNHPTLFPLTDFVGLLGIDKVRAAVVWLGAQDVEIRLFGRSANDPDDPNAWQGFGAGWTTLTNGNDATNTDDLSLPAGLNATTHHFLQLALGVRMKSGGSNPGVTLRVAVGVTYA